MTSPANLKLRLEQLRLFEGSPRWNHGIGTHCNGLSNWKPSYPALSVCARVCVHIQPLNSWHSRLLCSRFEIMKRWNRSSAPHCAKDQRDGRHFRGQARPLLWKLNAKLRALLLFMRKFSGSCAKERAHHSGCKAEWSWLNFSRSIRREVGSVSNGDQCPSNPEMGNFYPFVIFLYVVRWR